MGILTRWEFRHGGHMSGKYFDTGKNDAETPDYAPLADASAESARIMGDLGNKQLAQSQAQYEQNMAVAKPIIEKQAALMDETMRQGKDYYDYQVSQQRPVEQALNAEAMAAGSEAKQQEAADRAVADSQGGYTRALNQAFRQSRRYGLSPVTTAGSQVIAQAQGTAAGANAARENEKNIGYAKKMDVAGMYRGLSGASQGAYSLATGAGNSAVGNQMAPGQALMAGNAQGAQMTGQGLGLNQQGLGAVLNSKTNIATAQMGGGNPLMGLAGAALGGWASSGFAGLGS